MRAHRAIVRRSWVSNRWVGGQNTNCRHVAIGIKRGGEKKTEKITTNQDALVNKRTRKNGSSERSCCFGRRANKHSPKFSSSGVLRKVGDIATPCSELAKCRVNPTYFYFLKEKKQKTFATIQLSSTCQLERKQQSQLTSRFSCPTHTDGRTAPRRTIAMPRHLNLTD